jgi:hypothetical protein
MVTMAKSPTNEGSFVPFGSSYPTGMAAKRAACSFKPTQQIQVNTMLLIY